MTEIISIAEYQRKAWSKEETALFLDMRERNLSLIQIAEILGRSYNSVENKSAKFDKKKRSSIIKNPGSNFWSYVDKSGGEECCWPWTGAKTGKGYGVHEFKWADGKKRDGAHRIALALSLGRYIAKDMHVLHSCDNPPCCNPLHLSEGTRSRNILEAYARNRRKPVNLCGESSPTSKLSLREVNAIRAAYNIGFLNREICQLFGVSRSAISHIISGRTWQNTTKRKLLEAQHGITVEVVT